jgi:hypothetical protein
MIINIDNIMQFKSILKTAGKAAIFPFKKYIELSAKSYGELYGKSNIPWWM